MSASFIDNSDNNNTSSVSARGTVKVACISERFRTRLCKTFRKTGECPYGPRCMFAHGKAQLRTKRRNVADGLVSEAAVRAFQNGEIAAHAAGAAVDRAAHADAPTTVSVGVAREPPASVPSVDLLLLSGGSTLPSPHAASAAEASSQQYIAPDRQASSEDDADVVSVGGDDVGNARAVLPRWPAAPTRFVLATPPTMPNAPRNHHRRPAARYRHDPYSLVAPTKHSVTGTGADPASVVRSACDVLARA